MMKNPKRVRVPLDERKYIKPDVRKKLFKEIYSGYPKRYDVKLVYAYLNTDPDLMVDYCVIYSGRNADNTGDLILFDIPPIYSDRSVPAYRYCRRTHQEDKFFEYGIDEIVIMDKYKFYEFITMKLGLSLKKGDETYWKNPNNYKEFIRELLDMSLLYQKKV